MERKKYPLLVEDYELYEEVGQGVSACVYRALCIPFGEIVAVKILDLEKHNGDLNNITREAQTMILVDHPNVLRAHCSFIDDSYLWVVMPYMAGGSCLHILKAAYPDGFIEAVIATVLREVLKGLEYLHQHGYIHRDVKAGNILVDARGGVKLGDFGVSACLLDSGDRQRMRNTFVGTPCWMAPEVMEQLHGYDFKADIWSFGITALELAHGHAPFSKYPPMKVLLMTLQNPPPGLDSEKDKKFSKSFKQMIAACLVKDPSKRPSAHKLLKHNFFKQARFNDYIARTILEGLSPLGERIKALKLKEADMLAQKKMPDGKKEELSQNEYKRGISGWNFNIEDMKAQAALILDSDETLSDKDPGRFSNSILELCSSQSQSMSSTASYSSKDDIDKEHDEVMLGKPAHSLSPDRIANNLRGKSMDDDFSAQAIVHNGSQSNCIENYQSESCESEMDEKHLDAVFTHSCHERRASTSSCASDVANPSSMGESMKHQSQIHKMGNCNEVSQAANGTLLEVLPKAPKQSVSNAEELDGKSKGSVVQQKGRFKVTSENVDIEKAIPPLVLPKSHSMQAITQIPVASLSAPSDAASIPPTTSVFQQLQTILQINITQRDNILSLMRQLSVGDQANHVSEEVCLPTSTNITEKFLARNDSNFYRELEAAREREKELMQEITDLQMRLQCSEEELQKLRAKLEQA